MAFWGAVCLDTLSSPFVGKGDVSSHFWLLLYWTGNTDASSSSAWHLKAELEQNGLQNSMPKIVIATTQSEGVCSIHCPTLWTRRSQPRPNASSSSVQTEFDLSGIGWCCLLCFDCFLHTDWRDWQLLWMLHCYKKSPGVTITGTLLMKMSYDWRILVGLSGYNLNLNTFRLRNTSSGIFPLYFTSPSDCYKFTYSLHVCMHTCKLLIQR